MEKTGLRCSLSPCRLPEALDLRCPPPPSGRQKNVSLVFFCGEGLTIQASAALSQLRKRHEINVMSMVFCGETPRRSVKVTLPSPLVPRRYGGSEMRWRMTVWQRCLRLHRLFHLRVYHLQVADPKRSLDIRRRLRRPSCNVAAAASLRFSQRGRGSSLGGPPHIHPFDVILEVISSFPASR